MFGRCLQNFYGLFLGTYLQGLVMHDYFSGMLSIRHDGNLCISEVVVYTLAAKDESIC